MRLPPLFRFGPRARSTSWGIALCTMFIVAGFSVVNGLGESMDVLRDNFSVEYHILTVQDGESLGFFPESSLDDVSSKTALAAYAAVVAEPSGDQVQLMAVSDPHEILPERFMVTGNDILAGDEFPLTGSFSVDGTTVQVVGRYSSTMFSPAWGLASASLLGNITDRAGLWNLAIAGGLTPSEVDDLTSAGFCVTEMIGIIQFLDSGMGEIEADANWVLVPSAFVIAVLAFSFMSIETSDRIHDIGILKTLGARRRSILYYLMVNAFLVSAYAGLLGVALGIVLSYGISTLASSMFTAVFVVRADEIVLLMAFFATLAAGMVGALLPSARMTLTTPVHDLKEGGQS